MKTFDQNIIEPSIEAQYYDNYELDDALEYIGDVKIVAKGSASLLAKEQKACVSPNRPHHGQSD